jgi:ABC-type Co2+ transport system permease subunit
METKEQKPKTAAGYVFSRGNCFLMAIVLACAGIGFYAAYVEAETIEEALISQAAGFAMVTLAVIVGLVSLNNYYKDRIGEVR